MNKIEEEEFHAEIKKLQDKMCTEFLSVERIERLGKVLAYADSYTHRCCVDPVGMGIMKDNGDGTLSLVRPKPFKEEEGDEHNN